MAVPIWIRQSLGFLFTKQRRSRGAGHQPTRLHFEVLEERVNPGGLSGINIYVANAALFSSTTPGSTTTWTPGANFAGFSTVNSLTFGTNAFTDLQAALNKAASDYTSSGVADTIDVAPGSLASNGSDNYDIAKPVNIFGASAGAANPDVFANYNANAANTTILTAPTTTAGTYNDIFRVLASNVQIQGFVLEGNHTGDDGISNFDDGGTTVQVNTETITQNLVRNFNGSGIYLDDAPAANQGSPDPNAISTGTVISANYVANNGNTSGNFDQPGIGLFDNFFANITGNTVVVPQNTTSNPVVEGITVKSFNASGVPGTYTMTISGNTVTVGQASAGFFINNIYQSPVTVNLSGNTVQAAVGVTEIPSGNTWGFSIKSISDTAVVNESGDTIGTTGGQFAHGIDVWNTGATNVTLQPTQIGGGAALSPIIGINLTNNDPFYGLSSTPNSAAITGGNVFGVNAGLQADGVANLSVSNTHLNGIAAISAVSLTGTATLTGVSVHGSGTSSMGFATGPTALLVSSLPDGIPNGPTSKNNVVITGTSLQFNTDQTINYSTLAALTVTGDDGPDTFVVTPSPTGATLINAYGNTPNANPVVDSLILVESGLSSPAINDTSGPGNPAAGNLTSTSFTVNNPGVFWKRMNVTVATAPVFTSPDHFTVSNGPGGGGTFTVTATGNPNPTLGETGAPPTGVTFDPTTGLLTVASTTATGVYTLHFTATNVAGTANQTFTLTVTSSVGITGPSSSIIIVGYSGSLTVTGTGTPAPVLTMSSAPGLPPGFTFNPASGKLSWSGILATSTVGFYNATFYATNTSGTASLPMTLEITSVPRITSASSATFGVGQGGTFTVTATGFPIAVLNHTALPAGVSFVDNGNNTGTLTVATSTAAGDYPITFTPTNIASDDVGTIPQNFTLHIVTQAPAITSVNHATYTAGTGGTFNVTATGYPTPTFTPLNPATGITLSSAGLLTVASTAAAGSYSFTITASNGIAPAATQLFSLTVLSPAAAPAFNALVGTPQAVIGTAGSITVSATGYPNPNLSYSSSPGLPSGFTFNSSSGTLSWSSSLSNSSIGIYNITFYAINSHGTATKTVVFGIEKPGGPTITSGNSLTVTHTGGGTFTVTANGSPTPTLSVAAATPLPAGATFTASTGVLNLPAGAVAVGTYLIDFVAANSQGSYVQPFTINVTNPQLLSGPANTHPNAPALTQTQLAPIVAAAIQRWVQAGITPIQAALLRSTSITIGNLKSTGELGDTAKGKIVIDATADGDGWYVDPTPLSNDGFAARPGSKQLIAKTGPAATEVDLLTVVMHEMGHILGLEDLDPKRYPDQLMTETLSVGVRRLPDQFTTETLRIGVRRQPSIAETLTVGVRRQPRSQA
jgi:Putative Ig domain